MTEAATPSEEVSKLQAKIKRLELAIDINKRFSETLDVDKLMSTILNSVTEALEAEACSFWAVDNASEQLTCKVAVGPQSEKIKGLQLEIGTGIVGWVAENKQNVVLFDASKDDRFNSQTDAKSGFVTKSMLCVPLVVKEECMGAIQILNKRTTQGQFDQNDLEMLELLAVDAAIAIKNALLYKSEQRIKELNSLLEISKEITSTLDLDRVLLSIVNLGSRIIHYEKAAIALLDFDENLALSAESHVPEVDPHSAANKKLLSIMRYVLDQGKPLHVTNYAKGKAKKDVPQIVCDYMDSHDLHCMSLIILEDSEGKLGVLSMEGKYAALVGANSQYVISMITNQATVALRNAQLYHNIPKGGILDSLSHAVSKQKYSRQKLAGMTAGVAIFLLLLLNFKVPYNVSVEAEVVPDRKTPVTTSIDGVISRVYFKEGQVVAEGDPLIEIDDSALKLERAKLDADRKIAIGSLRRFESSEQAAEAHLSRLDIQRLDNELALIDEKLARTKVLAPVAGRILTAKPEELLEKQVGLGDLLVEIAVNDVKRVRLLLDEAAATDVQQGDSVSFTLRALPDQLLAGKVKHVSHALTKEELSQGYETYVDSDLLKDHEQVRLGMTGMAKVHMGKRSVYQIYVQKLVQRMSTRTKLMFLSGE